MSGLIMAFVVISQGIPRMITMRSNDLPAHWIFSFREIGWSNGRVELFTDPAMDIVAPNIGAQFNCSNFFVAGRMWIFNGGWLIKATNSSIERAEIHDASGFNIILGYTYSLLRLNYQFLLAGKEVHNSLMLGASPIKFMDAELGYDFNAASLRAGVGLKFVKKNAFFKLGIVLPGPGIDLLPVIDFGVSW